MVSTGPYVSGETWVSGQKPGQERRRIWRDMGVRRDVSVMRDMGVRKNMGVRRELVSRETLVS